MSIRTFLALDLDEAIRGALSEAQAKLNAPSARIRWTARQNLHVTLQFLGEVEEGTLAEICRAAERATAKIQPFNFAIQGLVCVPPRGHLRMIWANAVDSEGQLCQLHETLAEELAGLGFGKENRPFKPHVTVARIKHIKNAEAFRRSVSLYNDNDFGIQHAEKVTVYSSKLTPSGPIYVPMDLAGLGKSS